VKITRRSAIGILASSVSTVALEQEAAAQLAGGVEIPGTCFARTNMDGSAGATRACKNAFERPWQEE
jgi:hypothetical protein